MTSIDLPADPRSVGLARQFIAELADDLPQATVDALELCVSEIATNCVVHALTAFRLTYTRAEHSVRVEASDTATGRPHISHSGHDVPHGRGLLIVSRVSDAWGSDLNEPGPGKTVWFELAV